METAAYLREGDGGVSGWLVKFLWGLGAFLAGCRSASYGGLGFKVLRTGFRPSICTFCMSGLRLA